MKNVAPVRREMGVRTIFNILGPLTNPAGAPNTLMGVFHPDLVGIQVRVMQRLGAHHVLVVWGKDGMDEISLGAATLVASSGRRGSRVRDPPEDFGLQMISHRGLKVGDAEASKVMLLDALDNKPGTPREIVALNAGAALYARTWPARSARASAGRARRSRAAPRAPSSTPSSPYPVLRLKPRHRSMADTPDILKKIVARQGRGGRSNAAPACHVPW